MKKIRRLFLLLCLITAGAQCAWSQSQYFLKSGSTTEGNLTFDLYSYYYSPGGLVHYYQETYAALTGINGTDDIVVIPDTLSNGAIVRYLDGTISNSEVLKLIFKGKISFSAGLASFIDLYPDLSVNGTLDCQHLQYVIFEGNDNDLGALTSPAAMQCPLLHDIYFIGSEAQTFPYGENIDENHQVYTVYPHWSNICTAPAENVTAHIADWNAYSLNNNKNVYRELKKCVPYSETYSVSLKSNGGGEVKVERWNWYDTSLDYTISSEGGEETITLYDDADFYRIYMYYSGNGQPTLLRNGTAVSTTLSFDGIYTYDDREQMLTKSYEVVFPRFNVNLMLTAGACDKGVEVWSGDTQVGSISKMGGTIWETVENAQSLQFRIPNQYLEKIILNGEDVTATLPSTTPDDPAYAGYTFYTLSYLQDLIAVEVRYSDVAPHPYESSEIRFDCLNGTGVLKNTKVWFEDGTYVSDNMGHTGLIWLDMRTISRIEVTMKPDIDDFAYAQRYNTLGTIVNNGDGTYSYTIPSENLTSSIVPLYFPTSDYGSVKTLISSKNDIKLGYYFGELAIYDGGFLPQYAQANTSLLNSDVTIMHKDNAEPGWDVDQTIGIIYVQVSQGTTFRLVEDGVDHTADCVWYGAGQRLTEVSSDYDFYMTPVAGYYYLLKNVTTDSYIVVDNGNGEISSPWQVQQTVHIIGDGSLSLRKGETVVESIGEGEPTTVSWTTNDNLTLAVTLPDGADIAHYEAILIIDGTESELQKVNGAFTTFDMGSISTAHNIVLITRQTGGFVNTDLLTQHIQLTGEQLGTFLIQYLDEGGADYDDAQADNGHSYVTFTSDEKKYIKGLGIYVNVPQGCTFKASFNGEEVTGFTLDASNYTVTLDESFVTDGTWVVEFKKPEGITWTGMITGDTEKDFCLLQVMLNNNAIDYNISAMEGCPYDTFKKQFVGNASELFIDFIAKDGYDFKLSFNGTEFPYEFTKELYYEEESLYDYRFRTTDADLIAPFLVEGTWVLTYKKVAEAGITWDGLIIGDVPQGATVDIGLADIDMKMEVFLNAEETSASDSYAGSTERIDMSAVITAPAGYNFKVWFNGEEKTDRFDENGVYNITSGYEEALAPYLQDGQWIVLFYDDLERYDLNGDKKVDIADVTTMVNKVLTNDNPSSNP